MFGRVAAWLKCFGQSFREEMQEQIQLTVSCPTVVLVPGHSGHMETTAETMGTIAVTAAPYLDLSVSLPQILEIRGCVARASGTCVLHRQDDCLSMAAR